MAKISLLDPVDAPDGTETVLVLKGGVAKRAGLGALVSAAFATVSAAATAAVQALVDVATARASEASASASALSSSVHTLSQVEKIIMGLVPEVTHITGTDPATAQTSEVSPTTPRSSGVPLGMDGQKLRLEITCGSVGGSSELQLQLPDGSNAWGYKGAYTFVAVAGTAHVFDLVPTNFGLAPDAEFKAEWIVAPWSTTAKFRGGVAARRISSGNGHTAGAQATTGGSTAPYVRATVTAEQPTAIAPMLDELEEAVSRHPGSTALALTDSSDKVWFEVTPEAIHHPVIEQLLAGTAGADPEREIRATALIEHMPIYGQSLSIGHDTEADAGDDAIALSGALNYGLQFVGGTRPQDGGDDAGVTMASFAPLHEAVNGAGDGETPSSGCAQMIAQLLASEDGLDLVATAQRLLMSNPGFGGQTIASLTSGTNWQRFKDTITHGKACADALNRPYANRVMGWVQGEANYLAGTARGAYAAAERQMIADWRSHADATEGVARDRIFLSYQTATWALNGGTSPQVSLAQLDVAGDPFCGLATPMHFMDYALYAGAPSSHLKATSSKWLGAYFGLAIKRWLWDGVPPVALVPVETRIEGNWIFARFPLDDGLSLVFDANQPAVANHGFTVDDGAGNAIAIAETPVIAARDWIGIRCASAPQAAWKLRAGFTAVLGHRGMCHLRDNNPLVFDPGGIAKPMRKWAPFFETVLGDLM